MLSLVRLGEGQPEADGGPRLGGAGEGRASQQGQPLRHGAGAVRAPSVAEGHGLPGPQLDLPLREKIRAICHKIYHAKSVSFLPAVDKQLAEFEKLGYGKLPVCMAKTQYSFTDDQTVLGAPEGFTVTVREVKVSAGAGFVVALTGSIMTMPGLPKSPAAERIDVDESGKITGLF